MKKITLLIALMITSLGFAQHVLIQDFETAPPTDYTIAGFEGLASATRVADPAAGGTRMMGFQLVSQSTGNPWQGAEVLLANSKIKLTTDKTVKVDVYSTQAFSLFSKVESGTGPTSGASANYTTPGVWQTLTLSYTTVLDGQGLANGEYSKISFFPGWKPTNDGFISPPGNFTIYLDNITAEKTVVAPDPTPTTAAPTPPARNAADVKSIYSNAYTPITTFNYAGVDGQPSNDNTYNTSWSPASTTLVQIAGNDTNKVTGLGFEGISFLAARFDATAFTHFHIDIWTPTATLDKSFNIKFSNWNGGAAEANAISFSATNASNPALPNPNPGTWISLDIPLTDMPGLRNDLVQFIITSDLGTVYYDNLYLYKGTALGTEKFETSSVKMYPNPVRNTLTIEANSEIQKVSVYNILGQEVMKASPKSNTATLQTNELQKGVYMVTTEIDGKVSTSKVVKE
jgi:hypothetical protein